MYEYIYNVYNNYVNKHKKDKQKSMDKIVYNVDAVDLEKGENPCYKSRQKPISVLNENKDASQHVENLDNIIENYDVL